MILSPPMTINMDGVVVLRLKMVLRRMVENGMSYPGYLLYMALILCSNKKLLFYRLEI